MISFGKNNTVKNAFDLKRQRLFVAELGDDSLGVVDLAAGKVLRTITGLKEPQGIAYVGFADSLYVANAGDGSVRVLSGDDFAPIARVELGDDADDVRVDAQRSRVLVGYGKGALAVIDPETRTKAAEIRLKGHPEGFQIDETGNQVFVNVPDAHEVEVVDLASEANRSLPTQGAGSNFPMAVDGEAHRVLVVFRRPPTLMVLSSQDGRIAARLETCGDADDGFVDAKRHRVHVRGRGCARAARGRLCAPRTCADDIRRAHLAVRSRARPALCRCAAAVERTGGDLGTPAGFMKAVGGVAALAAAAVLTGWSGAARAYRPFDGTDAAVAETGEMEIELGPVEYLREGADCTLFAPNVRINYGFTPGWEAVLEGILAHDVTAGVPGTSLVGNSASLKGVLREGSLQEKPGSSIATEFGVLLPGMNDEHGAGVSLAGIVSQRWSWGTCTSMPQLSSPRSSMPICLSTPSSRARTNG